MGKLVLPLLILALAAFVYSLYGFNGPLLRDYAIYLYSGQRMAEGVPPYVSVFDHKGPLAPMITGLGVMLSKQLSLDDIYTVRVVFFATGCLAVVAVYLLGSSVFRSQVAGFFGSLTFLGFYAYGYPAASGPEPKTPMVLFEALSLLFMVEQRWFWAGLFGSLAFLIWQPMAVFPFVTLLLAAMTLKQERYNAVLRALAGIMTPLVAIAAYFYYHGSLGDLLDGAVLFNARYLTRGHWQTTPLVYRVLSNPSLSWDPIRNVIIPYSTSLIPIIIGLAAIMRLYFLRPFEYRFLPILLSFPAPFLWALLDFQLSDDFFVYLPYVAIGFGAFLVWVTRQTKNIRLVTVLLSVTFLGVASANTLDVLNASAAYALKGTNIDLSQQKQGALEIEERFGEDVKLASINSPQVLVLLHRINPNPYLFITAGIDQEIDAKWPGGFEGWLQGLETSDAITFLGDGQTLLPTAEATPKHRQQLANWLHSYYHVEKTGPWWLYIKHSLDNPDSAWQ
ncbi:MAG: hypothetical protein QOI57_2564 [Rubrobacteraceae bacterium]|nr:hypothetical protein [Rubrobacteraceae bacterium]